MSHAGLPLTESAYDLAVVGGGMLGLAAAFYLRQLRPEARLLIVESGGVPSEGGATHASSGIFHHADLAGEELARARWSGQVLRDLGAETGTRRPHDAPFRPVGWLRLDPVTAPAPDHLELLPLQALAERLTPAQWSNLKHLVDLSSVTAALYDPRGGYGSAESAALAYGYAAVRLGADLMLNTRVHLENGALTLERLDITARMEVVVARRERVRVAQVIVAAGARSPELLEEAGVLLPGVGRAYRQFPRLEGSFGLRLEAGRTALPVVSYQDLALRPRGEGLLICPPPLPPDPAGYRPQGARFLGVSVGLRRESLEALLERLEAIPALGWPSLNLGKTAADLQGAWEVIPPRRRPAALEAAPGVHVLLGGEDGYRLGLAVARELAGRLAGQTRLPWQP